ncbi:MAG TPA: hypothetical protein VJ652_14950 [Noviherbaspirillum sp.]|nr:hypothetical protein [Noviherbaspirillum sp.]
MKTNSEQQNRSTKEAVIAARQAQKMGCTRLAQILLTGIDPLHAFLQGVFIDRSTAGQESA